MQREILPLLWSKLYDLYIRIYLDMYILHGLNIDKIIP